MKKFLFLLAVCIFELFAAAVCGEEISVEIDGAVLEADASPQIVEGRTMVPVRAIFEGVGAEVLWDGETKTVTGSKNGLTVVMQVNNPTAIVNGAENTMDISPLIINERVYAPARYVGEGFGFSVKWDEASKTVKIVSSASQAETASQAEAVSYETTTEASTQTTAEATTEAAQPYDKYSEKYSGTDMRADVDLPAGKYVVMSNTDKFAGITIYEYGSVASAANNTGKKIVYTGYTQTNDVVLLESGQYISVTNGAAVPEALVEPLDISKNGKFRVGADIPAKHYTFKLDPDSSIGYIEIKSLAANAKADVYYLYENNTQVTIKLEGGSTIKKYGVDIYDASLILYADYSPASAVKSLIDDKCDFSLVSDGLKNKIILSVTDDIKSYNAESKSSSKYTKTYIDEKISEWNKTAVNESERQYISQIKKIYYKFYDFTHFSKPEYTKSAYVNIGNTKMTGGEYKKAFEACRDEYLNLARQASFAKSYSDLETIYYNMQALFVGVPNGQGVPVKS